ncbi:hypothetical protein K7432_003280 [Basidiobolus ranarum]|uniref:Cytochrome c oxidase assembly protein COX20, mitochondrial n=1 Tax=Basidiobolus ranarum TaxID=34480 RepID=A0ABR2W6P2_9FUNG
MSDKSEPNQVNFSTEKIVDFQQNVEHTPEQHAATVSDAVKSISVKDFSKAPQMPCFRDSVLYGIGSGTGLGVGHFLLKKSIKPACNWAVGGFALVSILSWEVCQYQRRVKLHQIETIVNTLKEHQIRKKLQLEKPRPEENSPEQN